MSQKFQATVHQRDDVTFVKLAGVIDEDNELSDLVDKIGVGTCVIDLGEVERINSCGVRDWVNWLSRLENNGAEVVLVELIRINFGCKDQSRFVTALSDKRIARALQQIHSNPHMAWTLEKMSEEVGMSRAAFARRFKELVGQPMFEYLTRLLIQRAGELLRETKLPLYEIASRVGYESDLAFTRTFKKHAGTTPTRFRKQAI